MMILDYASQREIVLGSRDKAMAVAMAENRVLCRVLGRWKMYVDARDISASPHLINDGMLDPKITRVLCDTVKQGMHCADIGASFGFSTLVMSELVGHAGTVVAFEPHPRSFSMLKCNVEINGFCPRTRVFPNAIGDTDTDGKTGKLSCHKRRFNASTMSEKAKASYSDSIEEPVQVNRLDTLALGRKEPDFYMIATEGYEPQVWAGMKGLLHSKRKVTVLMEFTRRWYADAQALATDIFDEGFLPSRVLDDGALAPITNPEGFIGPHRFWVLMTR